MGNVKKILTIGLMTLLGSNLIAKDCTYTLAVSNDLEGKLIKYTKEGSTFNITEKNNKCKLNIVENNSHIQTVYQLLSENKVDGALIKNYDLHTTLYGVDSTENIIINNTKNISVISKTGAKSLKDLKGQKIYLTKSIYTNFVLDKNAEDVGLNAKTDFEIINVENEYSLLKGYKDGTYNNIVLDKATLLTFDKANKIFELKNPYVFSIIANLKSNDDNKNKFIKEISNDFLNMIKRDTGGEYQIVMNKLAKDLNVDLNTVKTLIKNASFGSDSNLDKLEEEAYNYVKINNLSKYKKPYHVFANGKLIGDKSADNYSNYINVSSKF